MSTPLTTIVAFVVVLSLLVFVHELGHFSMAKLWKVRVLEFAIGFPPRLFSMNRGETTYAINSLPLGGYVRMMGENGDDADNPGSFGYKPWWQRASILLGGPAMNIALAIVLTTITYAWLGLPTLSNQISSLDPYAQSQGLKSGDHIIRVDGVATPNGDKLHDELDAKTNLGHKVHVVVQRAGKTIDLTVIPRKHPPTVHGVPQGPVGFAITPAHHFKTYPFGVSAERGFQVIGATVMVIPNLVSDLVHGNASGISGPVGIARSTGQAASSTQQYGIGSLVGFVALISASLGVFNLLPIPALDGGRIVFVLLAGIRRRNFDPQVEGAIHFAGMAVLLMLILLVTYNDISNWTSAH